MITRTVRAAGRADRPVKGQRTEVNHMHPYPSGRPGRERRRETLAQAEQQCQIRIGKRRTRPAQPTGGSRRCGLA